VTLVTFDDLQDAQECDLRISLLRKELGLPDWYEFRFSGNSNRIREASLSVITPYKFFYHVAALDKRGEKKRVPTDTKEDLNKLAARLVFEQAKSVLRDARVVIYESGARGFRNEMAVYFRRHLGKAKGKILVKGVKAQRSAGNNLLQLADYVAGVSARFVSNKSDGAVLRSKFLRSHEVSLVVLPK
jgi:hypothetical protein